MYFGLEHQCKKTQTILDFKRAIRHKQFLFGLAGACIIILIWDNYYLIILILQDSIWRTSLYTRWLPGSQHSIPRYKIQSEIQTLWWERTCSGYSFDSSRMVEVDGSFKHTKLRIHASECDLKGETKLDIVRPGKYDIIIYYMHCIHT